MCPPTRRSRCSDSPENNSCSARQFGRSQESERNLFVGVPVSAPCKSNCRDGGSRLGSFLVSCSGARWHLKACIPSSADSSLACPLPRPCGDHQQFDSL